MLIAIIPIIIFVCFMYVIVTYLLHMCIYEYHNKPINK